MNPKIKCMMEDRGVFIVLPSPQKHQPSFSQALPLTKSANCSSPPLFRQSPYILVFCKSNWFLPLFENLKGDSTPPPAELGKGWCTLCVLLVFDRTSMGCQMGYLILICLQSFVNLFNS